MENNKSLIHLDTSIAKIDKQIKIGDKLLELIDQSFVILISKSYSFQLMNINEYENLLSNLDFSKKIKNIFPEFNTIAFVTRKSKIIYFTKFGKYFSTSLEKMMETKDLKKLFKIEIQDEVIDVVIIDDKINNITSRDLIFISRNGLVKKSKIELFLDEVLTSKIAIKLRENDLLINISVVSDKDQLVIGSKFGALLRFDVSKIRSLSKNTYGDIGINLSDKNNIVVASSIIKNYDDYVFVVTEKGNVVKVRIDDYRITNRGSKGVRTLDITIRTGFMAHINIAQDNDTYLLTTNINNIVIIKISDLEISNRVSEGRKVITLIENEVIDTVVKLPRLK